MSDSDREAQQAFASYYDTAELYYAYHLIYTTANQPFKTVDDATLFNAARSALLVQQGPGSSLMGIWTESIVALQEPVFCVGVGHEVNLAKTGLLSLSAQVPADARCQARPSQGHCAVQGLVGAGGPCTGTTGVQAGALCI